MSTDAGTIAQIMLRYAEAMRTGDGATVRASYGDDIVLHYAGANPLSGAHRGVPAMLAAMGEMRRRTGRQLLAVVDVMIGAERACIVLRERFSRDGEAHEVERLGVYRVAAGKIRECWVFDEDQALIDRLLRD
jgi:ketosteroid isomerase-like protein